MISNGVKECKPLLLHNINQTINNRCCREDSTMSTEIRKTNPNLTQKGINSRVRIHNNDIIRYNFYIIF